VIRGGCQRLPDDVGSERYREWTAELSAILGDPDLRSALARTARMLRFAVGTYRSCRESPGKVGSPRSVSWSSQSRRRPLGRPAFPDGFFVAIAAVVTWVVVIVLVRSHPPVGSWNVIGIAGGFVSEGLGAAALIRFIRWARRQSKRTPRP